MLSLALARLHRTISVMQTAAIIGAGYVVVDRATKRATPEERAHRMDAQHRKSAERVARLAGRLRGLLTKAGQYLSARPDLLPEPYIEPLARLQDAVPPHPYAEVARQIERELGRPLESIFPRFERRPLASASLAQVHRATLADGREVAVKVQYPGIEQLVASDLRNLGLIVAVVGRIWPRYDFRALYREVQRLVPAELDFHHEAGNAERIAADLAGRIDVVIPAIVREHSSRRVLTMTYIDGIRIGDVPALRAAGLEPGTLAGRIVDIFGSQVIEHGFFHGDPHPGNIFALRDGRIALLDFGQVLELPAPERRAFAQLAVAGAERNAAGMIAAVRAIGIGLPGEHEAAYLGLAAQVLATLGPEQASSGTEADVARVNAQMARGLRQVSLDDVSGEALFVFRVQGLLRGLRARLGSPGPVLAAWAPYARRLLEAEAAAD